MKPLYVDELGFELGSLAPESTPLITYSIFPHSSFRKFETLVDDLQGDAHLLESIPCVVHSHESGFICVSNRVLWK